MRWTLIAATLVLLGAPLGGAPVPPPVKRVNLLVNGGFEEGPPVGSFVVLEVGDRRVKGWVVTRAGIDLVGDYWPAAEGKRSLDLHGSPGKGGISQTFATKVGRTYSVRFSLAGFPQGGEVVKLLGVSAAGKSTAFRFDTKGRTVKDLGWVRKEWTFKAVKDRTTLELYSLTGGDDVYCGPAIDNVVVVEE